MKLVIMEEVRVEMHSHFRGEAEIIVFSEMSGFIEWSIGCHY